MRVLLTCRVDHDEEPLEAEVDLPVIPRRGDYIRLTDGSQIYPALVAEVTFSAFEHDRVEVFLLFDHVYDADEVRSLMQGAREGTQW